MLTVRLLGISVRLLLRLSGAVLVAAKLHKLVSHFHSRRLLLSLHLNRRNLLLGAVCFLVCALVRRGNLLLCTAYLLLYAVVGTHLFELDFHFHLHKRNLVAVGLLLGISVRRVLPVRVHSVHAVGRVLSVRIHSVHAVRRELGLLMRRKLRFHALDFRVCARLVHFLLLLQAHTLVFELGTHFRKLDFELRLDKFVVVVLILNACGAGSNLRFKPLNFGVRFGALDFNLSLRFCTFCFHFRAKAGKFRLNLRSYNFIIILCRRL